MLKYILNILKFFKQIWDKLLLKNKLLFDENASKENKAWWESTPKLESEAGFFPMLKNSFKQIWDKLLLKNKLLFDENASKENKAWWESTPKLESEADFFPMLNNSFKQIWDKLFPKNKLLFDENDNNSKENKAWRSTSGLGLKPDFPPKFYEVKTIKNIKKIFFQKENKKESLKPHQIKSTEQQHSSR